MKYDNSEEWADYPRGLATDGLAKQMSGLINEGCTAGNPSAGVWRTVLEMAAGETECGPSPTAVQCAKAIFSAFRPEKPLSIQVVRLLLDRTAMPAAGGVRSEAGSPNRLLYRDDRWLLDVAVATQEDSSDITLTGQIMDILNGERSYRRSLVRVLREDDEEELSRTTPNDFGEFQMTFRGGGRVLVIVRVELETLLLLTLPAPRETIKPFDRLGDNAWFESIRS